MTSTQTLLSEDLVNAKVYMPHDGQNFQELMADRIGPSKDGCFYVGEMTRGNHTMAIYHCFSTTILADNESGSFIGYQERILDCRERLETLLETKLVPMPPR